VEATEHFQQLIRKEDVENLKRKLADWIVLIRETRYKELRLKMERACEYLDHSDYSIEQISDRLGFDSKSYFIRTFRREIGMLPTAYRHKI
jgi:methylphosphotriester-DNA--protein-cysteine methyltransferase